MNRLVGKVAVVTGASKGIGAAIAKGLASAGTVVAVNVGAPFGTLVRPKLKAQREHTDVGFP